MTKSGTAKENVVYLDCQEYAEAAAEYQQAFERVRQRANSITDEPKAFGYYWAHKEAIALGNDITLAPVSDPDLAHELYRRMLQWRLARIDWHLFVNRKVCPAAFDEQQTKRWRDAAQFGLILGDHSHEVTDQLVHFIKQRGDLSQREYRMFLKTALENKPADWRHPELDTYLMLAWPIVSRFNWTYGDVLDALQKKFPGQKGYPFDATHNLIKHCAGLGLRTANKPRTARPHPKGKAPLLQLALEISTEAWLLRQLGFLEK
jgi:hypothetical protein